MKANRIASKASSEKQFMKHSERPFAPPSAYQIGKEDRTLYQGRSLVEQIVVYYRNAEDSQGFYQQEDTLSNSKKLEPAPSVYVNFDHEGNQLDERFSYQCGLGGWEFNIHSDESHEAVEEEFSEPMAIVRNQSPKLPRCQTQNSQICGEKIIAERPRPNLTNLTNLDSVKVFIDMLRCWNGHYITYARSALNRELSQHELYEVQSYFQAYNSSLDDIEGAVKRKFKSMLTLAAFFLQGTREGLLKFTQMWASCAAGDAVQFVDWMFAMTRIWKDEGLEFDILSMSAECERMTIWLEEACRDYSISSSAMEPTTHSRCQSTVSSSDDSAGDADSHDFSVKQELQDEYGMDVKRYLISCFFVYVKYFKASGSAENRKLWKRINSIKKATTKCRRVEDYQSLMKRLVSPDHPLYDPAIANAILGAIECKDEALKRKINSWVGKKAGNKQEEDKNLRNRKKWVGDLKQDILFYSRRA